VGSLNRTCSCCGFDLTQPSALRVEALIDTLYEACIAADGTIKLEARQPGYEGWAPIPVVWICNRCGVGEGVFAPPKSQTSEEVVK